MEKQNSISEKRKKRKKEQICLLCIKQNKTKHVYIHLLPIKECQVRWLWHGNDYPVGQKSFQCLNELCFQRGYKSGPKILCSKRHTKQKHRNVSSLYWQETGSQERKFCRLIYIVREAREIVDKDAHPQSWSSGLVQQAPGEFLP